MMMMIEFDIHKSKSFDLSLAYSYLEKTIIVTHMQTFL